MHSTNIGLVVNYIIHSDNRAMTHQSTLTKLRDDLAKFDITNMSFTVDDFAQHLGLFYKGDVIC